MALSQKAVRVFAAVEVLRENRTDIRHALAALFEPDLAQFDGELFDARKLAEQINNQYKLGITSDVIEGFVDIFLDREWIKPLQTGDRKAFVVKCQGNLDISTEQEVFADTANKIAKEFREFISSISPLSQVNKKDGELIDDLVDWLLMLDRVGEEDLKAALASRYKVGTKIFVDFGNGDGESLSETAFLCARFVDHLFETKSSHIKFLTELGEVGLITEVVRDFQRPLTAKKSSNLAVYLDAPLALDMLGLSGVAARDSVSVVLNGLVSIGGSVRVFRQSVEEMKRNLRAFLARNPSERTGPTAEACRRNEVLEPYVRQVAAKPETFLAEKGVVVVEQTLDMFPNEHKFFDKDAVELLYSQIGWVREDLARDHDASIAAMATRKRAGARSDDIFDVKHVVLTRNPDFPKISRRICLEKSYIGPHHVGPVVHQRQLATAIWLRAGALGEDEIPRRHIIAACRRVLTLRKNIVEKVHQLKAGLSAPQAEQLELLLMVDRSTQVLMDKTLGSAALIDSSNIEILLEEMKKVQIKEHVEQSALEIEKMKADAKAREKALKQIAAKREAELVENAVKFTSLAEQQQYELNQRNKALDGIYNRAVEKINIRIKIARSIFALAIFSLFTVVSAINFFGNLGLGRMVTWALFAFGVLGASLFQFNTQVSRAIVDPLFQRYSNRQMRMVCSDLGINEYEFANSVSFDGHRFARLNSEEGN